MNTLTADKLTIQRLQTLHPALMEEAIDTYMLVLKNGVSIRVTRGLATWEEQAAIYDQGRTKPGPIVTYSKPGFSWHNYGLAFDFVLLHGNKEISWSMQEDLDKDLVPDWMEVVNAFEVKGWRWGGRFKNSQGKPFPDNPHFQKTFGLTLTQAMENSRGGQILNFTIPGVYQRFQL